MNTEKIKEIVKITLMLAGSFVGAAIAVQLVLLLMWACYYAGIPM